MESNPRSVVTTVWLGLALCLPLALLPPQVRGQSATLSMSTDNTEVVVGRSFRLQIRAEVAGRLNGDLTLPSLDAFDVVSRRVHRNMPFSFGFGPQQAARTSIVYDFVLQPRHPGTVRLPPASMIIAGQRVESNPVELTVVPNPAASPTPPTSSDPNQPPPDRPAAGRLAESSPEAVDAFRITQPGFLRTVVSKGTCVEGEQLTVSIYLYYAGSLRSAPQMTKQASSDGFWVKNLLPGPRTLQGVTRELQGQLYSEYLVARFAAFPLRSGSLRIGAPEFVVPSRSLLDLLRPRRTGDLRLVGQPAEVTVRAAPQIAEKEHPIVGRFSLTGSLDEKSINIGDPTTYTVTVSGSGNPESISLPDPIIEGVRVLPPEVNDHIEIRGMRVVGNRTWTWLLIPERPGTFTVPVITMDAFDPRSERWNRLQTPVLSFTAAGSPIPSVDANATEEDDGSSAVRTRLPPLRSAMELRRQAPPVSGTPWFKLTVTIPPFLFVVLVFGMILRNRVFQRAAGAAEEKRLSARLVALGQQAAHLEPEEARDFYRGAQQLLLDAIGLRVGTSVASHTRRDLRSLLVRENLSAVHTDALVAELEGLESACFSEAGSSREEAIRCIARITTHLDNLRGLLMVGTQEGIK